MALTAAEAEAAEFSGRRGDAIARQWTRDSGTTVYVDGSELVQIRNGPDEADDLVATSGYEAEVAAEFVRRTGADPEAESFAADLQAWLVAQPVAAITTTGTALAGDPAVIAWQITAEEYSKIPSGSRYWLGIDAEVDGVGPREIQRHPWSVLDQTAVRSAP